MVWFRRKVQNLAVDTHGDLDSFTFSKVPMHEVRNVPVQIVPDFLVRNGSIVIAQILLNHADRLVQTSVEETGVKAAVLAAGHRGIRSIVSNDGHLLGRGCVVVAHRR